MGVLGALHSRLGPIRFEVVPGSEINCIVAVAAVGVSQIRIQLAGAAR
jgi:hypothetical protein